MFDEKRSFLVGGLGFGIAALVLSINCVSKYVLVSHMVLSK